jgi:alkaline phosphatase D
VVIGGDIHSYWTNDLKLDFETPLSPTVGTEFAGTSIPAHPPPYEVFAKVLPDNPHVKFFESRMRLCIRRAQQNRHDRTVPGRLGRKRP